MGKKSDKIDSAKAKLKEIKAPKGAKTAAEIEVKELPPSKTEKAPTLTLEPVVSKTKSKQKLAVEKPTFEEIQVEAYHIGQKRLAKGIEGTAAEDWIAAEKALFQARSL